MKYEPSTLLAPSTTVASTAATAPKGLHPVWHGGDAAVVVALCRGLKAAGEQLVTAGYAVNEASAASALVHDRSLLGAAQCAVDDYVASLGAATGFGELRLEAFISRSTKPRDCRGDDLAVCWTWERPQGVTQGVYPVNLKDEGPESVTSLSRFAKRYSVIHHLTGVKANRHVDTGSLVSEVLSDPGTSAVGNGVLAFVKDAAATQVHAYDPVLLFACAYGAVDGVTPPKGPVAQVIAATSRALGGQPSRVADCYDNEGYLLQVSHLRASLLWDVVLAPSLVEHAIHTAPLVQRFSACFASVSYDKAQARVASLYRDRASANAFLYRA